MTAQAILQIDAGNSGAKWRCVTDGRVVDRGNAKRGDSASLTALSQRAQEVDELWLASVLGPEDEGQFFATLRLSDAVVLRRAKSSARCAGVTNSYEEPERMGVDRWLALLAARARCRTRVCVVDAGTALTIDWLAADGCHEGGYIIPGPKLMESALFGGTGRVRASNASDWPISPGTDTATAVGGGIALALAGALREALLRASTGQAPMDSPPALLVTGGYGERLLGAVGVDGEYAPDLVFEGLELAVAEMSE